MLLPQLAATFSSWEEHKGLPGAVVAAVPCLASRRGTDMLRITFLRRVFVVGACGK